MLQIAKPSAIDRSYQLLALLDICEHSVRNIDDLGEKHLARVAGSLANVIELASELASEIHDVLERGEKFSTLKTLAEEMRS